MSGNEIGEIRGVAANQNLDEKIAGTSVLQNKLNEFGDKGKAYQKKTADMKLLTTIEAKTNKGVALSAPELRFLYELDEPIVGFGFKKDPRIQEIISKRNIKKDLAQALNIQEDEISTTTDEALSGKSKYHYGNLSVSREEMSAHTKLPEIVTGSLSVDLTGLNSKDVVFPKSVAGRLFVAIDTGAEVTFPMFVGGNFEVEKAESFSHVVFPETVEGHAKLQSLKSIDGDVLPKKVGQSLMLDSVQSANHASLPEWVGISVNLKNLQSLEGVTLPSHIGWHFTLSSVKNADGVRFPEFLKGLDLASLESGNNIVLPKTIEHDLVLTSLRSGKGITFPKSVGELKLGHLESSDGLHLPAQMHSLNMNLKYLTSAKGLVFPQSFGSGNVVFTCPPKIDGLTLPRIILGRLYMNGLEDAHGIEFPKSVGELYINTLKSKEGILLPTIMGMPK